MRTRLRDVTKFDGDVMGGSYFAEVGNFPISMAENENVA